MATVVAKNLHGKQHTASQRAMIANSLLPFYQAEAKERQKASGGDMTKKAVTQKVAEPKKGLPAKCACGCNIWQVIGNDRKCRSCGQMLVAVTDDERSLLANRKYGEARVAAGKAANVNHTYVDKASDIALVDKNLAAGVWERTYAAAVVRFSRAAHRHVTSR